MYDPSIGQASLTKIDVIGVLTSHLLFGVAATFLIDWSWIPLSPYERHDGRTLKDIKRGWGWDENTESQDEFISSKGQESLVVNDKE